MKAKSSKWVFRIAMGVIAAILVYSIFLIYWKMYFVGK